MSTNSLPLVVITDYITEPGPESAVLEGSARVAFANLFDDEKLADLYPDAEAFIVFHDISITARSLSRLSKLRGVVRCGVGYDNVDLKSAGEAGIVVCNVPDYGTEDVADHAIMMMLAVSRRLKVLDDKIREGGWDPSLIFGAPRLRGKTFGVLGCGRIGTATALRAKTLGMRVVIYDPYQPPGYEKAIGVERYFEFDKFLAQSEFVSVHTPLTPETRGILNRETMSQLPKGAYVINTARGACVDHEAVVALLDSGHLAGAGLDVLSREPLDYEPLRRHPRVLLTPHAAYYSVEGFVEMRTKAGEEVKRIVTGQPVRNPVNRAFLTREPRCTLPPSLA